MSKPRRGEIYWIDFDPVKGAEQGGRRPALIVQNDRGNASSRYTVVCAISSAPITRSFPFIVPVAAGEANLTRSGHVNCAQIRTVDQTRLEELVGTLSDARMLEVAEALRYELDI